VVQLLPEGRVYKDLSPEKAPLLVAALLDGGSGLEDRLVWDYSLTRAENLVRKKGRG
jgi:(2Fe-2S) ferredoxin